MGAEVSKGQGGIKPWHLEGEVVFVPIPQEEFERRLLDLWHYVQREAAKERAAEEKDHEGGPLRESIDALPGSEREYRDAAVLPGGVGEE